MRMAETDLDLQDVKVQREILVFLVSLVSRVRTVCRDLKDIQDAKGTLVEMGIQAFQENQA